ncbi:REP-associated tyrosine transposase [Marivita sp. S0852]|uniref:REP-associated tyrosine transposase n=1 Tax=Marivita sp. S0852 TaxID=3373893 RepID=UPI003982CF03
MPNYQRPKINGAIVFFTVTLANRQSTALTDNINALRQAVRATKAERPFGIEAWVVLPDHLHCIWRLPEDDHDYSTRWRLIKSRFARAVPKGNLRQSHIARGERGVWQRRFWEHHIRSDADFEAHLRYCWLNPVKHGFVERPEDWVYSSVHRDARYIGCGSGA